MEIMIYTMHVLRERKKYKVSLEILKGVRTLSHGGDWDSILKMSLLIGHSEIKILLSYNNKQPWLGAMLS